MKKLLLALAFTPTLLFSQSRKERKALELQEKADQQVIVQLRNHVQNLTTDQTAGSSNDVASESPAVEYISNQYKTIGLQPKGTNGYVQPYKVDDGKRIEPSTYLRVNDKQLEVNKDYFPLPYSAEKKVAGMPAIALRERGVPWFIDLKEWLEDGAKSSGKSIEELIKKETVKVAGKGATALFLYNSGSTADSLYFNTKDKSAPSSIPVIYITSEGHKKYFHDHSEILDIELNTAFKETNINGSNVIGYIDNAAPSTIVIGAHYNAFTTSTGKTETAAKGAVSGADDNSSGIAALIELARMLSASKAKSNNYLFIAFGGNDKGSVASNYWLENSTVTSPVNYMINLDMMGSYSEGKKVFVHGYKTSPVWNEVFTSVTDKKVEVAIDSISGLTDPAISFFKKGIPELSFSAASHADYLTTPDLEGKINYPGVLQIVKFINKLVEAADSKGSVAFLKNTQQLNPAAKVEELPVTKPVQSAETSVATLKTVVSLGVIPDKAVGESGLKISAVSPKKLASRLGLQPGDVLTDLGSYKISDFKSYMQALSNFKTGDKTTLRIKRGKDDKEFAVEF